MKFYSFEYYLVHSFEFQNSVYTVDLEYDCSVQELCAFLWNYLFFSVGLDGKFQTLICLGVRDGVLHRWFYMMSQSLAASKSYDNTGIFKQDSMLDEIMGLLKILEDLSIPVDVSLIHQTER